MKRQEAIAKGYVFYCLECTAVYKKVPTRDYADGHSHRQLESCRRCGCDLFARLDNNERAKA